ncbi:hypothetical protein AB0F11_36235 [Streptomyces sp. NPDC032472]|uniref:hypothetical protein n=1 Tax=Streptomyces sp. NPDC032472 TaxID=3155018 RepID=UPI0033C006EE
MLLLTPVLLAVVLAVVLLVLAVAFALGALVGWFLAPLSRPLPLWGRIPLLVITAAAAASLWAIGAEVNGYLWPLFAGASFLSTVMTATLRLVRRPGNGSKPRVPSVGGVSRSGRW